MAQKQAPQHRINGMISVTLYNLDSHNIKMLLMCRIYILKLNYNNQIDYFTDEYQLYNQRGLGLLTVREPGCIKTVELARTVWHVLFQLIHIFEPVH